MKLKKCPFCDPQPEDAKLVLADKCGKQVLYVSCNGCGACGPYSTLMTPSSAMSDFEYVIDGWNNRKIR